MDILSNLMASTHFWLAVAFGICVVVFFGPTRRGLKTFGGHRAGDIAAQFTALENEKKQAQKALDQALAQNKNQPELRRAIIKKAQNDIVLMKGQEKQQLEERLKHQQDENDLKKRIAWEQAVQAIKTKTIAAFVQEVKSHSEENVSCSDAHVDGMLDILTHHKDMLGDLTPVSAKKQKADNTYKVNQVLLTQTYEKIKGNKEADKALQESLEQILSVLTSDTIAKAEKPILH